MKHRYPALPAALLAISCFLHASPAKADTYTFTINTPANATFPFTASGTLTTDSDGSTQNITSLTGTGQNGALTGDSSQVTLSLTPVTPGQIPSTLSFYTGIDPTDNLPSTFTDTFDNVLTPGAPLVLDGNGLTFESSDGIFYDIGSDNGQLVYEAFDNNESFDQRTFDANVVPVSFTLTPLATSVTPEPTSIALLGTGLLGATGILRRRRGSTSSQ